MSAHFWNGIVADHAAAQLAVATPEDRHRDWLIEQNWLGEWEATHPDFDPTPVHLYDGPSDSRHVSAKTRDGVIEEIDFWIEENS